MISPISIRRFAATCRSQGNYVTKEWKRFLTTLQGTQKIVPLSLISTLKRLLQLYDLLIRQCMSLQQAYINFWNNSLLKPTRIALFLFAWWRLGFAYYVTQKIAEVILKWLLREHHIEVWVQKWPTKNCVDKNIHLFKTLLTHHSASHFYKVYVSKRRSINPLITQFIKNNIEIIFNE